MTGNPSVILLVEDNPDHAEMIKRLFERHRVRNEIQHVTDGEMAMNYLLRRDRFENRLESPRPAVILLDLRLPKVDGLEILRQIKQDRELRQIPVVVLTTSDADVDVAKAYEYHANSYLVKPLDFLKFTEQMETLGLYWLAWNKCPFSS